ncbi:hypothetical protein EJ04DRAFT_517304 [Polyplosphaeria fusca]|uniref:Inositol-pentakisphosphate 2-kinase n=1 Tax=Polyplosphaeria fusca TaxID=682080 RepID=A0A9P4QHE3_9PLEO|nr:hypothetical protein EJ04DRAFT_517304 [Polyplosphaeria fusca]
MTQESPQLIPHTPTTTFKNDTTISMSAEDTEDMEGSTESQTPTVHRAAQNLYWCRQVRAFAKEHQRDPTEPSPFSFALDFLAEGAANAVFTVRPWTDDSVGTNFVITAHNGSDVILSGQQFRNKVLRFSKGAPNTPDCKSIIDSYYADIKPLFEDFDEHLLHPELTEIEPLMVNQLNKSIAEHAIVNPRRFKGWIPKIGGNQLALIIDNMSSIPGSALTIEIKPKWLAQSASAIRNALRCRTCAMQSLNVSNGESKTEAYICPLRLASGNAALIKPWVQNKVAATMVAETSSVPSATQANIIDAITSYFSTGEQGNKLLAHLRTLQVKHDPIGIMRREEVSGLPHWTYPPVDTTNESLDRDLRLAMTLRDCSLYVRVHYEGENVVKVESKLGDLDFKSANKMDDWWLKEQQLINGEWYKKIGELQREVPCEIFAGWRDIVQRHWG